MQAPISKDVLDNKLKQVNKLLDKQKLVENLVHKQSSAQHDLIEDLVHKQHLVELEKQIKSLHIADLAYILEVLPPADRKRIWEIARYDRGGYVLLDIADAVRESLIDEMDDAELIEVLKPLDGDELSYIADDLPETVLSQCLQKLSDDEQSWLRSALSYGDDTVGYLMSSDMVVCHDTQSIADVAKMLRDLPELPGHNDKIFVVDRLGILAGALTLWGIVTSPREAMVRDVMARDIVKFLPYDDAGEAAKAYERYDLISAPVVNERGKLIGRLTVDVIMDYIREQTTDEVLSMAGLGGEEDIFASAFDSAKNRSVWLIINLFSAFIASRVIGAFEDTLVQLVALAALMPIVASVGGNSGNQTTALIIRGISLGQVTTGNTSHLFRKELSIGLLNGMALGVLVGLFAWAFYQNWELAVIIAVAMLLTMLLAASLGLLVPIVLDKMGKDPALGSSVIQTATTDSLGFLIFLGLASMFLVR